MVEASRGRESLVAALMVLLALLYLASTASASGGATTSGPRLVMVREWAWNPPFNGSVVGIAFSHGIIYALLQSHGSLLYALNASSGGVIWAVRVSTEGGAGGLAVSGSMAYVAVITSKGNSSVVTVYGGSRPPLSPVYQVNFTTPLYRILAAQPLPSGEVAIAGARYRLGRGYQYYVALASNGRVVWERLWGGPGDEFLNTVSIGPDMSVCAAGPSGALACFSYDGGILLNESLPYKPLSLAPLGAGRAVVAGVTGNASGIVALTGPAGVEWARRTGALIPTALAAGPGGLAVAGVIAPAPYALAVLLLSTNGSVLALGYSNETSPSLLPLAVAVAGSTVYVGGEREGRPFIEAILVGHAQPPPPSGGGGGAYSRVILVEEIALAAAAAALAVTLAALKPWRWRRR